MPDGMEEWSYRRRVAQPFVSAAASEYDVFARWYEDARESGLSYRRTDMLEDWRREKGLIRYQAVCEQLRDDTQPPDRIFTDTPWEGLRSALMYEFRIEGWDRETGESFVRFGAVTTDTHLTVGEAKALYDEAYIESQAYGEWVDVIVSLIAVRHKTGAAFTG
jgi:hypothetical protein